MANSEEVTNQIESMVCAQVDTFGVLDREFLTHLKNLYQDYLKQLVWVLLDQSFNAQVVVSYFDTQNMPLSLEQLLQNPIKQLSCQTLLRTTPIPVPHQKAFLNKALLMASQMPTGTLFASSYQNEGMSIARRQERLATLQLVWSERRINFD